MSEPVSVALQFGINADAKRGIDYYIDNVVAGLAEIDDRNRYLLFSYFFRDHARLAARLPHPRNKNFKTLYRRFPESIVGTLDLRRGLPLVERGLLRGQKFSVYHVLGGGFMPHMRGAKTVVTFFDLMTETHPASGAAPDPGRLISDPFTCEYARRADCLVATGEQTKRNLMRYYAISEDKIEVISTGVDLKLYRPIIDPARLTAARKRYGLPERYLMIIGPFVPPQRTNAQTTMEVYAELSREGKTNGCRLVFAGAPGAHLDKLMESAVKLGIQEDVVCTGYVALEDMPAVYTLAEAVIHPTSITGFGFAMEAFACGTPFITSNLPGVVEAAGDAALTVPPVDAPALKAALKRLLMDPILRRQMSEAGLARASRYSYDIIAGKFIRLYERLARGQATS